MSSIALKMVHAGSSLEPAREPPLSRSGEWSRRSSLGERAAVGLAGEVTSARSAAIAEGIRVSELFAMCTDSS